MLAFLLWYLLISIVGWVSFPLIYRLLPGLPDRGFSLSRALGWLVWGYLFWILASLGVVQNDLGGVILALALLIGASILAIRGEQFGRCVEWIKGKGRFVLTVEILFLLTFAAWAFVRANNPDISGTEKPMELAFINAILRSPGFPPSDPWLSGYAISYYYFGYVLVAMLIRMTGVVSGAGFNLAIALIFGLTAIGAYGLVYNLLAVWRKQRGETRSEASLGLPLLGPFFTLIVSNLEGFLEVLHARGIFWPSGFWSWLKIQEIDQPPATPLTWMPNRPGGIVWWRASRVLGDFNFLGKFREVIDEFPFFSYLLADLHPHVLGMPFSLAMIGLGMNLFLHTEEDGFDFLGLRIPLSRSGFLFYAIALGGLSFLNTWDFPIYLALVSGAFALRRAQYRGWSWSRLGDFFTLAIPMGLVGGLLYLPFYVGFSSQAGGILPSLIYFTRGGQFWVMFAPLLLPILGLCIYWLMQRSERPDWRKAIGLTALVVGGLWLSSYIFAVVISLLPTLGPLFMQNLEAEGSTIGAVISASLFGHNTTEGGWVAGRFTAPGAWISLALFLALALAILLLRPRANQSELNETTGSTEGPVSSSSSSPVLKTGVTFWTGLVILGVLLVLAPEFYYLRDQFGTRMNTIFKFYYQAWLMWSIAAAIACAVLLQELRRAWAVLFRVGLAVLVVMGLAYPIFSVWIKTNGFHPSSGLTLDGTAQDAQADPDEAAAIRWLQQAPVGVVAEAVGSSYSGEARISEHTGDPTVLGWTGHEVQWRGNSIYSLILTRQNDIQNLYQTGDWAQAQEIIMKYNIRYIVVGLDERVLYHVDETKFQRFLTVAMQSGSVTVYQTPDYPFANTPTGTRIEGGNP